jgi:hypothetical protein
LAWSTSSFGRVECGERSNKCVFEACNNGSDRTDDSLGSSKDGLVGLAVDSAPRYLVSVSMSCRGGVVFANWVDVGGAQRNLALVAARGMSRWITCIVPPTGGTDEASCCGERSDYGRHDHRRVWFRAA